VNAVPAAASLTETTVAPMVEEADTVVDISHVDVTTAERLALATPSREESVREAMDADTVTAAKVSSATNFSKFQSSLFSPAMNSHQISNILLPSLSKSLAAAVDFPHTTPPPVEEDQEAHQCVTLSREESAREATDADSLTVMRREVEEEEDFPEATTLPPETRLARATRSREESAREVTAAVTTTARRALEILPPATTTVVAIDPVACASPSRRESASVASLAASHTRPLSHPATTLGAIKRLGQHRESPHPRPFLLTINTIGNEGACCRTPRVIQSPQYVYRQRLIWQF
jgi:hypothetical protein